MPFIIPIIAVIAIAAVTYSVVVGVIGSSQTPKPGKINFGLGGASEGSPRYGTFGPLDNTISNEIAIPVLYGQLKLAGNRIWQTAPGSQVSNVIGLCEGPINSITDVRANNISFSTDLLTSSYTTYLGTNAQTTDSRLPQAEPQKQDYSFKRLAYIAATLVASDKLKGGNPTITSVCQGLLVQTYNGLVWSTSTSYSNNPVACVRDFLTNTRYGLGLSVSILNAASFGEASQYCDELVDTATGKEARYQLDFAIDNQRPAQDVLNDMLATFNGFLVYAGNQIKLRCEKTETVTQYFGDGSATKANAQFDPGNIVKNSFQWNLSSIDDRPNRIRVQWVDPNQNYVKIYTQVEDRIDQDDRNTVIVKDISLLGITRQSQASRMAKFHMSVTKYSSVSVRFAARLESIHCEVGDVVSVTHQSAKFVRKLFRVTDMQEGEDETIWYTCREYNASIYDDHQGAAIVTYTQPSGPNLYAALSDVTALTLSEDNYRNKDGTFVTNILVSWTALAADELLRLDRHLIQISNDGGLTYRDVAFASSQKTSYRIVLGNVQVGSIFFIRVKTISDRGAESPGVSASLLMVGKHTPPSDVTGFDVNFAGDHLVFSWAAINDQDLFGYEIRVGDSASTWETAAIVATEILNNRYEIFKFTTGAKTYFIKAIDNSQNYSANAGSDSITITDIPAVTKITTVDLWNRVTNSLNPLEGTLSSNLVHVPTTHYNPSYYREELQPATANTFLALQNIGAQNYSDYSSGNHVMSINNGAYIDTAIVKLNVSPSAAAAVFVNATKSYISTPDSSDWEFGAGNFSIESFVRFTNVSAVTHTIAAHWSDIINDRGWAFQYSSTSQALLFYYSTDGINPSSVQVSWIPVINTWYHLAVVRSGSNILFFVDGTQQGTSQNIGTNSIYNSTQNLSVGAFDLAQIPVNNSMDGYMDEVRISNIARYTAAFTPTTSEFANDGNTMLLLHFSKADSSYKALQDSSFVWGKETLVTSAETYVTTAINLSAVRNADLILDLRSFSFSNLGFIGVEISTSNDDVTYSAYASFTNGLYNTQYVKFRFTIQSIDGTSKVGLTGAFLTVSARDKTTKFSNESVSSGGRTFYLTGYISVTSIIATIVGSSNLIPRIHDQSSLPTQFDIRIFDTAGALQAGNVNVLVSGY